TSRPSLPGRGLMRTTLAQCLSTLAAAAVLLSSNAASAQGTKTQSGEFTVQRFEPAPGTKNFLSVEGLRMDGAWGFSVGLGFDYAKNPFVVLSCVPTGTASGRTAPATCDDAKVTKKENIHVVSDMFTWNLLAAVSPVKRLQIGLRLPLAYVNGEGIDVA